jgi:hypothetical protein
MCPNSTFFLPSFHDFTPLCPRDYAWAAPWHPPIVLPRLPLLIPFGCGAGRTARVLRVGEQDASGPHRHIPRWGSL